MYSPRRRYRKYYSKKYYRNNLFAPSLKKAPAPNYYQMKGRILQQTPRNIQNEKTQIVTRKYLDDLYHLLVDYKYPIPSPVPPTPIDPSQFFFHFVTDYSTLATLGDAAEFNNANIYENFVEPKLAQLPPPPEDHHYIFNVTSLIFHNIPFVMTDTSRYVFTLNADLLTGGPLNLIEKNNDTTLSNSGYYPIVLMSPGVSSSVRIGRVDVASGSINYSFNSYVTQDTITSDDGFYPLLTSDINSESYPNYISYTKTAGSQLQLANYSFAFSIDIELVVD